MDDHGVDVVQVDSKVVGTFTEGVALILTVLTNANERWTNARKIKNGFTQFSAQEIAV